MSRLYGQRKRRYAFVKTYRDVRRLVRSFFRSYAHLQYLIVHRFVCRVLKVQTFVRQMPNVLIFAIIGLAVDFKRNIVDKETSHYKQQVAIKFADLVYNGQWFTPLREALSAFVDSTQQTVTGDVKLKQP